MAEMGVVADTCCVDLYLLTMFVRQEDCSTKGSI